MKYKVELSISGYLEVEAESEEAARSIVEEGYNMAQVVFQDDDIGEIEQIK